MIASPIATPIASAIASGIVAIFSMAYESGLSLGVWSGAYQTITVSAGNTYYRINKTTVTSGTLPDGVTDNNDGSFTNNTGRTLVINDWIEFQGYATTNYLVLSLGSDEGGSDAVILNGSGMIGSIVLDVNKGFTTFTHYEWLDGDTIFPMIKNISGAGNIDYASSKHYFEVVG